MADEGLEAQDLEQIRQALQTERAHLEAQKAAIRRVRRVQRLWWAALLALGFALGYATAEWTISPVTIIVPSGSGISV